MYTIVYSQNYACLKIIFKIFRNMLCKIDLVLFFIFLIKILYWQSTLQKNSYIINVLFYLNFELEKNINTFVQHLNYKSTTRCRNVMCRECHLKTDLYLNLEIITLLKIYYFHYYWSLRYEKNEFFIYLMSIIYQMNDYVIIWYMYECC